MPLHRGHFRLNYLDHELRMRLSSAIVTIFLMPLLAFGQDATMTITGRITNFPAGEPLEGASVFIAGSRLGSATSSRGLYRIEFSVNSTRAKEIELRVEYIGYKTASFTLPVKPGPFLMDFQLTEKVIMLKEIVATPNNEGEYSRKEKSRGYASQKMTAEDLERLGTTDWVVAMRSLVAGLDITGSGGIIGSSPRASLRGNFYLNSNKSEAPLIVVDGTPLTDGGEGFMSFGSAVMDIGSENIESVEVVKGPALFYLYGNRAIRGAIIIKTKRLNVRFR